MDLLDIAIAKQLAGGGGGSGTNNYNDLSNQPKINDVTLSGNKTASALGLQNEINSENLLDADLVDDTEADNKFVTSAQMLEWSGKQDKLTFDNVPTSESNNPVKSGGIYIALAGKENSLSANSAAYKDYETTFSANSNDKIPTSKSISDNVADNAKLTNYQAGAGTSFQTIDPTSDKVTDAIEKVQNNALFNKTNILSVADWVGKNVLNARSYSASGQATGITVTVNDDCSVTLNGTSSSSNNIIYGYFDAEVKPNTRYAMKGTGNSNVKVQLIGYNDINNPTVIFNDVNDNVGSSGNWQYYRVRLWIAAKPSSGTQFSNVTIYPMLCPEELWNISQDFAPYALPNYDLTRLEAEDRASLAEVVDSGAKNLLENNNSNVVTFTGITYTKNNDGSVTVSGTNTGSSRSVYSITSGVPGNILGRYTANNHVGDIFSIGSVTSDNDCYAIIFYSNDGTTWATEQKITGTSNVYDTIRNYPYYNINICVSAGKTINPARTFYPMICTKALFDASPTYQPYSLPNTAITPELIELVDSGAKNLGKYNNSMPSWSGATITVTDDGITVSGTATGSYTGDVIPVNIATTTEPYVFAFYGSKSGFNVMLQWKDTTSHYDPFTDSNRVMIIPAGCKIDKVYMQRQTSEAATVSGSFKVMWCTLTAWNVSHKYVPYRPNWDLVGKKTTLSNQCIAGNLSEFKFDISDYNSSAGTTSTRYRHGLLVGGTNANDPLLYHLFIDNNNVPTLTAVLAGARTFTATCSDNTLTITANNIVYGGLRLLWLD